MGWPLSADNDFCRPEESIQLTLGAGRTTTAESVVTKTKKRRQHTFHGAERSGLGQAGECTFIQIFNNSASFVSTCFSTEATYLSVSF
jgi:hypothetical protein